MICCFKGLSPKFQPQIRSKISMNLTPQKIVLPVKPNKLHDFPGVVQVNVFE
jgi:hypothetical protein